MKYRFNQKGPWTYKDLQPESIEEEREEYRKNACWNPNLNEKPVERLPFPILRCYWLKLAEEQEDKRVKGKEMYFNVRVFDKEPDLEQFDFEDYEPIDGIIERSLVVRLPLHGIINQKNLRLVARSNTRRLTYDELKIAYPKLYESEEECQDPNKTFFYSIKEMRQCFISPSSPYELDGGVCLKNLYHFTKRAIPLFTIKLSEANQ